MVKSFCNVAMVLAFVTIAGGNIIWNLANSYVACGLALVAAFLVRFGVEHVFIESAYREMIRLRGGDCLGGNDGDGAATEAKPRE